MSWNEETAPTDAKTKTQEPGVATKEVVIEATAVETPAEAPNEGVKAGEAAKEKVETAPQAADNTGEAKVETTKTEDGASNATTDAQKLIGKVAKAIREKAKENASELEHRIKALEEENQRLRAGTAVTEPVTDDVLDPEVKQRIDEAVQNRFLEQQTAYGREKYGKDFDDALQLIRIEVMKNPSLWQNIVRAASPADTLMREATRIAEEIEYGSDPRERESKKMAALKAQLRKELEAEFAAKLKARNNQPKDVGSLRAAGGDVVTPKIDSWNTTLPG